MPKPGFTNAIGSICAAASAQDVFVLPDGELLERYVADRCEIAFEALVRRHGPMVLGVCRRLLTSPSDAEDAFQATFLVLVRKAPSVLPREKVANWLYGVAYRAAQKARATTVRRRAREKQVRTLPELPSVADGFWQDVIPLLDQELSRLPEKYRLPLVLCELEGRSRTEAAKQLNWPEGTVAGRLARGRALLARKLARHGVPMSGGVLTAVLAQNELSAGVPVTLVAATGKIAAAVASGQAVAGVVSDKVTRLSTGVLQAMSRGKLKAAISGILVATLTLGLTGMLSHGGRSEPPTQPDGLASAAEPPATDKVKVVGDNPDRAADAAAKELQTLQGVWRVVGIETDRKKASPKDVEGMRWTFKGTRLLGTDPGEEPSDTGEVKLDPEKTPKHFDLIATDGNRKGKTVQGIYKLEKGRLTICFRDEKAAEKGRPTEFTADAGSGQALIILESLDNPPKPEPKPVNAPADVMQGKRWVVKNPTTLELVGPAGTVGPTVTLPRFRLEPGQELVYTGEVQHLRRGGSKLRTRNEARVWVVRANPGGGWRVVIRSMRITRDGFQGNPEREIVSFSCGDLFPDGRIVEPDSLEFQARMPLLLPRLPADATEGAKGWAANEERTGESYRYRLLPSTSTGGCDLEAVSENDMTAASGVQIKLGFHWNTERGLPETMQFEPTYSHGDHEHGSDKLGPVTTHDPAWCKAMAADAERYFAAQSAYHRTLARPGGTPAEAKTALEKARADLTAARRNLERAEFQAQVDRLLAEHNEMAPRFLERVERQAAIIGKPAADWSTTDLDGKPHALKDYRGKIVILDFWYRGCTWCVRAMPQVKEIATRFKDQPVVVLGMNIDARDEDARAVMEKMGLNYPTLTAMGLPEKYNVNGFPTLIVIDQEGVVRNVHTGYSATLKDEVVAVVERLQKAKP